MSKQFTAEIKSYDPDHEEEATFDTRKEAEEWLLDQRGYGHFTMRLNNERVRIINGHVVNDEPEARPAVEPISTNPAYYDVFATQREKDEFAKTFRPQPTRGDAPANPATLAAKGDL